MIHDSNNKPDKPRTATGNTPQDSRQSGGRTADSKPGALQGEGNYEAAREFNEAERKFVASGKVDAAARAAAPRSEAEEQEMLAAEREGRSRAKEEDPNVKRSEPDESATKNTGRRGNG